jgi:uncharacterized phage-associated protein
MEYYTHLRDMKILLFEYLITRLIEWYNEVSTSQKSNRQFTRLTALKLLFFVSTIKDEENNNNDLLDIFDKFCAMQYGPVESDIYTAIATDKTKVYKFGIHELTIIDNDHGVFDDIEPSLKTRIDKAVSLLKSKNPKIVLYPASLLIDISHKWSAWQEAMSIAEMFGKRSEMMSVVSIRSNRQFYE